MLRVGLEEFLDGATGLKDVPPRRIGLLEAKVEQSCREVRELRRFAFLVQALPENPERPFQRHVAKSLGVIMNRGSLGQRLASRQRPASAPVGLFRKSICRYGY